MTLFRYVKSIAGEFLLLLISAASFACVIENAFFLSSVQMREPITVALTAVLLVILYFAAYQRKRMVFGIVAYIAALAVALGMALAFSTGENVYADAEGNYLYLAFCIVFAATGSFLLTRSLPGAALWFLVSAFACSVVQAFYQCNQLALSLVVSAAALALAIYRNFNLGLMRADAVRKATRASGLLTALGAVAAAGAIALAGWFMVIAPMNPQVAEIKLITEYRQLPVDYLRGVADEQPVLNLDLTTDRDHLSDDSYRYTTDDLQVGESDVVLSAQEVLDQQTLGGGATDTGTGNDASKQGGLDPDSLDQEFDAQSYSEVFPYIVLVLIAIALIVALVVAFFLWRRHRRIVRLRTMLQGPPADQARAIYQFLLSRFNRLGFKVPPGFTLSEFAAAQATRMAIFDSTAGAAFADLTRTYEEITFGSREPSDKDIVPFIAYYLGFWKAARAYLGNFKYFFKSFRL